MLTGRVAGIAFLGAGLLLGGCSSGSGGSVAQGGESGLPSARASAPAAAPPQLTAEELAAVKQDNLVILFKSGSDQITPESTAHLDTAARLFRDVHPVVMFAIGYSDPKGDEFDNLVLAGKRARAVKQALVARGIPADQLLIQALGASELANATQPLSPENRRALVKWRMS